MTREELFLSQLTLIERVSGWVCARRGLRGADVDDFASIVKARLIENDYEILARFEGRSSLKTYLVAVINHVYLDYQTQRFGRWRPSAEARRLGPVGLRLEQLMFRDGLSFDEACSVLENDGHVSEPRDALYAMSVRFARRVDRSAVETSPTENGLAAAGRADRQALAQRTFAVIDRSLASLPASDRVFLRLHFESGLTVAEAARILGVDQKALYRRKEQVLVRLRSGLEAEGIGPADAHELLARLDWSVALPSEETNNVPVAEKGGARPSQSHDPATRWEGEQ
jgi:RNA polymerase sigma factor for flagellar operon FliA